MTTDTVPLARATLHYLATLTEQGYSPETVRLYRENLAQFAAFLGGLSPYMIHQHGRALRSFSTWLWRHGYLATNRLADFHPGRLPEREVEPLSQGEQQQVLAAVAQDTYADARGHAVVPTLLDSGLRASELCGLTLDGLDLDSGEVRVRRGKRARPGTWRWERARWRRCTCTCTAIARSRRCRRWTRRSS